MVVVVLLPLDEMEYMKTILGGAVMKNVKLVVFLDTRVYMELIAEAKSYDIVAKTDSQLIGKIIHKFINDMPMYDLQIEQLKKGLANKTVIIEDLRKEIADLKTKKKVKKK